MIYCRVSSASIKFYGISKWTDEQLSAVLILLQNSQSMYWAGAVQKAESTFYQNRFKNLKSLLTSVQIFYLQTQFHWQQEM